MDGGKAQANRAGLCHAPLVLSGKPLRPSVLVRITFDVANNAGVEREQQRRLGGDSLVLDYVVARNRSGMQQDCRDRQPADPPPKTHTHPFDAQTAAPYPKDRCFWKTRSRVFEVCFLGLSQCKRTSPSSPAAECRTEVLSSPLAAGAAGEFQASLRARRRLLGRLFSSKPAGLLALGLFRATVQAVLPGQSEDAVGVKLGYGPPGRSSVALRREAAVGLGVLVLLLNIAAGALSLSHFGTMRGLAFVQEGEVAICSGGGMHFLGADGKIPPGGPDEPQQWQYECTCCVFMQAGTAPPQPAAELKPAELTVIHILRPGAAQHLEATAVPTRRNRGPPSQA